MIISFIRHGESISNAKGIFSSDPNRKNGLTELGRAQIEIAANNISGSVSSVYTSPFVRTVESAEIFIANRKEKLNPIIDERLREIDYGNRSDKKDSPEMAEVSKRQIAGDYEVRFGETGENKREIVTRFYDFLISIMSIHKDTDHIVVFSHGRAISILEGEIHGLKGDKFVHRSVENGDIKQIDLSVPSDLKLIQQAARKLQLDHRVGLITDRYKNFNDINNDTQRRYKSELLKIANYGIDDQELSTDMLNMFTSGLYVSSLTPTNLKIERNTLSSDDVILICSFKDAGVLIASFIEHHRKLGVSHFVFIDNNSSDNSTEVIEQYNKGDGYDIDLWFTDDVFDGFKAMGWKQRLIAYYGVKHWYLNLDIDEFFVYFDMESHGIDEVVNRLHKDNARAARAIMLDTYPNRPLLESDVMHNSHLVLQEYKYIDSNTYNETKNDKFKYRFFGGPRARAFGLRSSLQKYPLVYVEADTIGFNPHFWYPYDINLKTSYTTALLHYKFLPGDFKKYEKYAQTGIHWNNSKEYKAYINTIKANPTLNLYDTQYSIEYINSHTLKEVTIKDAESAKSRHIF